MKIAVKAKTIYNNHKVTQNQILLIDNGILINLDAKNIPIDFKIIETEIVCPGFLDLQIYGAGKSLFSSDLSHHSLDKMETELIGQGCTGYLATLATNTDEVFYKAIEVAKSYKPSIGNFLGLHLEGPFINPEKRGAHLKEYVKIATVKNIKTIIDKSEGVVKMMTLAPEIQSDEVIKLLNDAGIVISVGHTMATFEEANLFFNQINAVTHLFNAMPAMHHREPGLIAAIFSKKPYTSIIADGKHVNFEMIKIAKKLLGKQLFLITDAVTECNVGPYQHVFNKDHYTLPNGTISGSSLTMLKAVQNCINHASIQIDEAIRMASSYPANLIGNQDFGSLEIGNRANCLLLDKNLNLQKVIFGNNFY
jgi:N-acetylglucosamine-6-phosphate deacetylase